MKLLMYSSGHRWILAALAFVTSESASTQQFAGIGPAIREITALPADCRSLLPAGMRGTVQPWQSYVGLEHCDRIKRLRRLSAILPPEQQPRFFEDIVPASRLPREIGVDLPVLRVVFPERTFFDTADSTLRPEADQVVSLVAQSLRGEPPDVALFVAGHADERGDRTYNERLSIDRANAIASAIFVRGVAASSIWRVGFGEDMPLASGHDPTAWDRNRRVEFLFAAKPEGVATWLAGQQSEILCQARNASEAAQCKARLTFRDGYDARELVRAAPVRIAPPPTRRKAVTPRSSGPSSVTVAAARPVQVTVDPVAMKVAVSPEGGRRIRIDPINKRAPRVRVDL